MSADAQLLFALDEAVYVDHRQIFIAGRGGTIPAMKLPAKLLWAGRDGAVLLSAAQEHDAGLRFEIWSSAPPPNTSREWEMQEEGRLEMTVDELAFGGPTTGMTSDPIKLPAAGTYAIRVYCAGREAVHAAEEATQDPDIEDEADLEMPEGLEQWLVQLWPG